LVFLNLQRGVLTFSGVSMSAESFRIGGRRPPLQHASKKHSAFGI
jgi:hypothetical protein